MSNLTKTFSENMKAFRKRSNLTQEELASRLGIDTSTIQKYEYGDRFPRLDLLESLARELAVEPSDLLSEYDLSHVPKNLKRALSRIDKDDAVTYKLMRVTAESRTR